MADKIRGITIELNGDSTGLIKAVKQVNGSLRQTQAALKDVNSLPLEVAAIDAFTSPVEER